MNMSDTTYTLEWRGAQKSGYSYSEIEASLSAGELHSLYKINVDGRWIVLRDFVEQQRSFQLTRHVANPIHSQPPEPEPAHRAQPSAPAAAPAMQVPSPLLQPAMSHAPTLHGSRDQKPLWFWPAIILSSTICLLIVAVTVYALATMRSGGQHMIAENRPVEKLDYKQPSEPLTEAPVEKLAVKPAAPPVDAPADKLAVKPATPPVDAPADKLAVKPAMPPVDKPAENAAEKSAEKPADKPAEQPMDKPTGQVADKQKDQPQDKPLKVKGTPISYTGKELFPTALISIATMDWNGDEQDAEDKKTDNDAPLAKNEVPLYGDENGWLGVLLEGLKKDAKVSVEITADGFMKPSKWEGPITALNENGLARIGPKILWDYEVLSRVRQQRPLNVTFSASIDGKTILNSTETFVLRSINDCPLCFIDKKGESVGSLKFFVAAYVNENHPQVEEVLKEALASGIVDSFGGYQTGDPIDVKRQVFAIWNALQRRGIKYSSVDATPQGEKVFTQSIRFMEQSINNKQANCVDGSVLVASVLEKIGIHSYLVLVPGHCFVAFDLTEAATVLPTGLETTMLGHLSLPASDNLSFLPIPKASTKEVEDSKKTFIGAMDRGTERLKQDIRVLLGKEDQHYQLISIQEARKSGIMPIPYMKDK